MKCRSLAYVGLHCSDVPAWSSFATDVLGAPVERESTVSNLYVRLDERHHRVSILPAKENGFAYAGFDLGGPQSFGEGVDELRAAGFEVTAGTAEEIWDRRVGNMAWFEDPAGFRLEICHGQLRVVKPPFRPLQQVDGMHGLGHVVFGTTHLDSSLDLYLNVLGFRVTDYRLPGIYFLRCSRRHHTVALAQLDEAKLHHFFLEVESIDDVGRALDRANARGVPITSGFGRHSNDRAISFYLESPNGVVIEYGCGGIEVDDETWIPHEFTHGDVWGHVRADPTDL
jgi:3,4-dihydroxy-9,10-secoandrosta-1,3,5(10)-triene-9,17-dione 4,5-dioxygenase